MEHLKKKLKATLYLLGAIMMLTGTLSCTNSPSEDAPMEEAENPDGGNEEGGAGGENENPENPQPDPEPEPESIFFSSVAYENLRNGDVVALVTYFLEENKVIRHEAIDQFGSLSNTTTYAYNTAGLLEELTSYDRNNNINFVNIFTYEQGRISQIERRRNTVTPPDTIYNNLSYSSTQIIDELVDTEGRVLRSTQHLLNTEGEIYSTDNGIVAEITLQDELPIFKRVEYPTRVEEFNHEYLDSPLPLGPWRNFWSSFYGSLNNQILVQSSGVISHEDTVDLPKYILSAGSQLQRTYTFDANNLPVRIEKTFSDGFQSNWTLEYQN